MTLGIPGITHADFLERDTPQRRGVCEGLVGVSREDAEAQTFGNEFFGVFGIKRRTVASFEEPVKKLSGNWGFIDLFLAGDADRRAQESGQVARKGGKPGDRVYPRSQGCRT